MTNCYEFWNYADYTYHYFENLEQLYMVWAKRTKIYYK